MVIFLNKVKKDDENNIQETAHPLPKKNRLELAQKLTDFCPRSVTLHTSVASLPTEAATSEGVASKSMEGGREAAPKRDPVGSTSWEGKIN